MSWLMSCCRICSQDAVSIALHRRLVPRAEEYLGEAGHSTAGPGVEGHEDQHSPTHSSLSLYAFTWTPAIHIEGREQTCH